MQAAILAFSLSFDEVIVTTFTAGQQQTLPIWIFSQMLKPRNRPITNVTAMLVVLITALPILLAQRLTARELGVIQQLVVHFAPVRQRNLARLAGE